MKKTKGRKSNAEMQRQLVEKGEAIRRSLQHIAKQDAKANSSAAIHATNASRNPIARHKQAINDDSGSDGDVDMDPYRLKDAHYIKTNAKYRNKQKTLVLASRGITSLGRQLMKDIRLLLPHNKPESKLEKKESYTAINTLTELSGCNSVVFIESRKSEMILWIAKAPHGPTIKGRLTNVHTLRDSTFFGNCLLYSRPLVTFDSAFDSAPHLRLIKQVLRQVFGTPNNHPKSKPFCDHCLSFFYFDERIFFRHYQIAPENEFAVNRPDQQVLTEIGPQFAIDPILILNGSFNGAVLWKNQNYMSHVMMRRCKREMEAERRHKQDRDKKLKKNEIELPEDELSNFNVFRAPE